MTGAPSLPASEWAYRSIADLLIALRGRTLSASELTDQVIARIEALDPVVHAFRAVDVDGQIITVYDASIHTVAPGSEFGDHDPRWVRCRRLLWTYRQSPRPLPKGRSAAARSKTGTIAWPARSAPVDHPFEFRHPLPYDDLTVNVSRSRR